jgi:hypothetical protein
LARFAKNDARTDVEQNCFEKKEKRKEEEAKEDQGTK